MNSQDYEILTCVHPFNIKLTQKNEINSAFLSFYE